VSGNDGTGSASAAETVNCPPTSQITPTGTTCSQFANHTASTLGTVLYSTKGTTISTDNPGVFFYWVPETVTGTGTQTFTITQTTTYAPTSIPSGDSRYFTLAAGSFAYSSTGVAPNIQCTTLATTLVGGTATNPNVSVTFTASAPGTYYLGIKYSAKSVVGTGPASKVPGFFYQYSFSDGTFAGNSGVKLQHS
jgi:hypothetical protein